MTTSSFLGYSALIGVVSAAVGYAIYFDYKRRTDPELRKKIRKEKQQVTQQQSKANASTDTEAKLKPVSNGDPLLSMSLEEIYIKSPADREKIFYMLLVRGEELLKTNTGMSIEYFYKALKLIPNSTELVIALQKVLPEPVFKELIEKITQEGLKSIQQYYTNLSPLNAPIEFKPSSVRLPNGESESCYGIFSKREIEAGEVIYNELPDVSTLLTCHMDGNYCQFCCKVFEEHDKVIPCSDCGERYCSLDCQKSAFGQYHSILCTKKSKEESSHPMKELSNHCESIGNSYGILAAKYLGTLLNEELRLIQGKSNAESIQKSILHHYEYFRVMPVSITPYEAKEAKLLKDIFASLMAISGDFLSEQRYATMKTVLVGNCLGFQIDSNRKDKPTKDSLGILTRPVVTNDSDENGSEKNFSFVEMSTCSPIASVESGAELQVDSSPVLSESVVTVVTPILETETIMHQDQGKETIEDSQIKALPKMEKPISSVQMLSLMTDNNEHGRVIRSHLPVSELTGVGLYPVSSHLSHSCDPNVEITVASGRHEIQVIAIKNITKGEELSMSFMPLRKGMTVTDRRSYLKEYYSLICTCQVCEAELTLK